ncbi:BglG family transcription antiterminator [Enterococcus pseudoavium]|uniref:Ascorbate-specific PTS system EIIA component n=1 Tax=Enterococcus pseudoavium TaxID=44007 RepID=A0ABU3FJ92_9ENTE|nr:BglG family transcription antiterminator [Enterococcus pseudoavium]MDT2754139.1 BglG family transcription antiterminator [Enterococcus pseudoavium]MDT2770079.1 BglG family transcription antiterminator [Enterococcus pseudoavium]
MNYKMSYLLSNNFNCYVTLKEAIERTGLSANELATQLAELNLTIEKNADTGERRIFIPTISAEQWARKLVNETTEYSVYSEEQRQALIYLLSYSGFEELSLFHFQDFLEISKGTAIADVKKLRKYLATQKIELSYTRKTGFYLTGDELELRRVAQNFVALLVQDSVGKFSLFYWLNQFDLTLYPRMRDEILLQTSTLGLSIVPSRIDEVSIFIGLSYNRIKEMPLANLADLEFLQSLTVYRVSESFSQNFFANKNPYELGYLTVVFMTIVQGEIRDLQLDFLLNDCAEIIYRMESYSAIQFSNFRELLMNLFYHLVPAYFRIRFGFYLPNVLIENIQMDYPEIFDFTKKALKPLEIAVDRKIPIEEVGFFSILFGGAITNQKTEAAEKEVRALIVCPNGISSSLILQTELKKMFSTIQFQEASSVNQLQSVPEESYDVVFSTIPLKSNKRVYLVKPLMSQLEKNQLINLVQEELLVPGFSMPSAEEIIKALLPYIELKQGVTNEKLYKVLNKKMNRLIERKEDNRPMLTELITPETIQICDEVSDWETAIRMAAKPLVDSQKIEGRYAEAMIEKVKQYGPFIHIGKGIALPHARPEDGVKELGMSLLKVEKPVLLLDDEKHEIHLFVCLAAVDNEAHLRALSSLTKLLSNRENLDALLAATTKEEIMTILTKGENE